MSMEAWLEDGRHLKGLSEAELLDVIEQRNSAYGKIHSEAEKARWNLDRAFCEQRTRQYQKDCDKKAQ